LSIAIALDIDHLRALVATTQQHNHPHATLNVIQAITWAVINALLTHARSDWFHIVRIAQRQPSDSGLNPRPGLRIPHAGEPRIKRGGLDDIEHVESVIHRIHSINHRTRFAVVPIYVVRRFAMLEA
jgi:hypothetical protein